MAAEEVVGSLAVKLALSSGSFDSGIKRVGTELKAIDSGFKASAAEAAATGQKFDTLGQKQEMLAQKLTVQQSATIAYRGQLDQLRQRMTSLGVSQTDLKGKVTAAKGAYDQAKQSLKEHQKAGDLTGEELEKLAGRVEVLRGEYKALTEQEKQVQANIARTQGTISQTEASYNAMRQQTAQTRQELARTETEIKKQASAWGKLQAAAGKYGQSLTTAGQAMNSFGNKASLLITAPVAAGMVKATKAAMDYEDQLAALGTMPGVTADSLKDLSTGLFQVSDATNTALSSLSSAEYQALSSGIAVNQATGYMAISAKAAKAGFADLTVAVDGSTSVLNAWKLDASAATDVYNQMIVAQNFGKTTLGEIAGSIGQVAATAAGLKVSYTEVLAATAAMTKGGIQTSQAMTMLNQVLANVLKPSAEATKTAKSLGLEFDAAAIKSKGLAGFLKDIEQKAGGNEAALAKLFGSVEAYKAVASLAGAQSADFAAALSEMQNSAGAVDKAFQTVSDTTGNKARAALNRLMNSAVRFGETMLPIVSDVLDKVDGLVEGLASMDEGARKNLLFNVGAAALIGPTVKGIGAVATTAGNISKLITGMGKAGGLAKAIGLVGLPLAAGAASIALLGLTGKVRELNVEGAGIKDRLMNVSIGLDDQSKADFDSKVNEVMAGTKKVMAIKAKISLEKADLSKDLDTAIADGKLTRGENNKLRKEINAWVDDGIAGVKTDTAAKAAQIAAALEGIAGLSEDSRTKIVDAAKQNGDKQIAELEGYQTELDTLLASMKGGTEAITADKIARYNELLTLIATMKGEIAAANEGLTDYYAAQKTFMESGKATPEQALAYTKLGLQLAGDENATAEQARKDTIIQKQKALEAAQEAADEGGALIIKQDIETEFQNEEQAKKDYQAKIIAVLNSGVAGALGSVKDGDARLSTLLNNYIMQGFLTSEGDATTGRLSKDPAFRAKFTGIINQVLGTAYSEESFNAQSVESLDFIQSASTRAVNALMNSITGEIETGDFNPVLEMLKGSMDGADLSGIDTAKLGESVKGLFGLVDFKATGGSVSKDIWQGVADGATENSQTAKDNMTTENNSLIQGIKDLWGIQSPSTVMKDIFKNVMLGGALGITENVGLLKSPFQTLTDTDFPKLGTDMVQAMIDAVNLKAEDFKTAVKNAVSGAITSAQLVANKGVKIPVSLLFTDSVIRQLSQQLGLAP